MKYTGRLGNANDMAGAAIFLASKGKISFAFLKAGFFKKKTNIEIASIWFKTFLFFYPVDCYLAGAWITGKWKIAYTHTPLIDSVLVLSWLNEWHLFLFSTI